MGSALCRTTVALTCKLAAIRSGVRKQTPAKVALADIEYPQDIFMSDGIEVGVGGEGDDGAVLDDDP